MGFNRLEAKLQAKGSMRSAYPHPMLITLVYFLATTVLVGVIQFVVNNPFNNLYTYLMQGYSVDEVYSYYYTLMAGGRGALFVFMGILMSLYSAVMGFSYTSYALRLARNEQPGYRTLLDGFAMAGRVLGMIILQGVFVFLWTLLGMLPFVVLIVVAAVTDSGLLIALAMLCYFAALIWVITVAYRYRLSAYFLLDDPACGALESITRSKQAMRGRKMDLFVLDLSFVGWEILSIFTLGILDLWLLPYKCATEANFYDWATGGLNAPLQTGPAEQPPLDGGSGPVPF